jgi:transposase
LWANAAGPAPEPICDLASGTVSGVGGRQPGDECGRTRLWCRRHSSISTCASRSVFEAINHHLVMLDRERAGREASPTAAVIDSQSVKTTESGGPRGDDAGKKIKGRKRHAMVDTDGRRLTLDNHPASVQDRDGAPSLMRSSRSRWPFVQLAFMDKRLLRVMRENTLLSPHRARRKGEDSHGRQIIITAPDIMWAIDATQIPTVQHGKVWLFGVAEHWNAEMLGWHVSKRGTRFEAIQALSMAVCQRFGRLSAGAARRLALRHDHDSNFMAEHFQ